MTRATALLAALGTLFVFSPDVRADGLIEGRLGIGIHAGAGSLTNSDVDAADSSDEIEVGGGGLQARYRLSPRWEIELAVGGLEGENDTVRRSFGLATAGALFHINPHGRWVWSALAGLGSAREDVEVLRGGEVVLERSFQNGLVYVGGGLERRFGHFSVAAELRAMAMGRSDEELDGPAFAGKDNPVPQESSGGQLRILGTYYF